jgi:hypothetical protein
MVPNPITKHNMETTVNMILVFGFMEYYCYNFLTNFSINFGKFVIIEKHISVNKTADALTQAGIGLVADKKLH